MHRRPSIGVPPPQQFLQRRSRPGAPASTSSPGATPSEPANPSANGTSTPATAPAHEDSDQLNYAPPPPTAAHMDGDDFDIPKHLESDSDSDSDGDKSSSFQRHFVSVPTASKVAPATAAAAPGPAGDDNADAAAPAGTGVSSDDSPGPTQPPAPQPTTASSSAPQLHLPSDADDSDEEDAHATAMQPQQVRNSEPNAIQTAIPDEDDLENEEEREEEEDEAVAAADLAGVDDDEDGEARPWRLAEQMPEGERVSAINGGADEAPPRPSATEEADADGGSAQPTEVYVTVRVRPPLTSIPSMAANAAAGAGGKDGASTTTRTGASSTARASAQLKPRAPVRCVRVYAEKGIVECLNVPGSDPSGARPKKVAGAPSRTHKLKFAFDTVLDESSTQETVMHDVGSRVVNRVLTGYNGTVLCYGQSGCGKTHTMIGPMGGYLTKGAVVKDHALGEVSPVKGKAAARRAARRRASSAAAAALADAVRADVEHEWSFDDGVGLLPRMLYELFQRLEQKQQFAAEDLADANDDDALPTYTATVTISAVELYNEVLRDLMPRPLRKPPVKGGKPAGSKTAAAKTQQSSAAKRGARAFGGGHGTSPSPLEEEDGSHSDSSGSDDDEEDELDDPFDESKHVSDSDEEDENDGGNGGRDAAAAGVEPDPVRPSTASSRPSAKRDGSRTAPRPSPSAISSNARSTSRRTPNTAGSPNTAAQSTVVPLQIRSGANAAGSGEAPSVGVYVEGLRHHRVHSFAEAMLAVRQALKQRKMGATKLNVNSSRAHTLFFVQVEQHERVNLSEKMEGEAQVGRGQRAAGLANATRVRHSVLTMADLAGSERVSHTGAEGVRLREAQSINLSLSMLGKVIRYLTSREYQQAASTAFVPYRDSKLTRMLQDSFGGNTITFLLCNVSPDIRDEQETLSTLRFATLAKQVKNKAVVNANADEDGVRVQLMNAQRYIGWLEKQVEGYARRDSITEVKEGEVDARCAELEAANAEAMRLLQEERDARARAETRLLELEDAVRILNETLELREERVRVLEDMVRAAPGDEATTQTAALSVKDAAVQGEGGGRQGGGPFLSSTCSCTNSEDGHGERAGGEGDSGSFTGFLAAYGYHEHSPRSQSLSDGEDAAGAGALNARSPGSAVLTPLDARLAMDDADAAAAAAALLSQQENSLNGSAMESGGRKRIVKRRGGANRGSSAGATQTGLMPSMVADSDGEEKESDNENDVSGRLMVLCHSGAEDVRLLRRNNNLAAAQGGLLEQLFGVLRLTAGIVRSESTEERSLP